MRCDICKDKGVVCKVPDGLCVDCDGRCVTCTFGHHCSCISFADFWGFELSYWEVAEEYMEFNEETKRDIAEARAEIKAGKYYTHEEVKKELGL
jgi:hypothetical protein